MSDKIETDYSKQELEDQKQANRELVELVGRVAKERDNLRDELAAVNEDYAVACEHNGKLGAEIEQLQRKLAAFTAKQRAAHYPPHNADTCSHKDCSGARPSGRFSSADS